MKIKWYGHSCFLFEDAEGRTLMTDPYEPRTGYCLDGARAGVVLESHQHFDHNYDAGVAGDPIVIKTPGRHSPLGIPVTGVETAHDHHGGERRGKNIMFMFEMDGIRVLHLGDLGCIPAAEAVAELGRPDMLFIPVGGNYTIDGAEAIKVMELFDPRVTVPMHYKLPRGNVDVGELDSFINALRGVGIHRLNQPEATVTPETLADDRIIVFGL